MTDADVVAAPVLHLEKAAERRAGEVAELGRDEVRHVRALRLSAGDPVRLTDGRGTLWGGELVGQGGVRLTEALEAPPPLEVELWVGVGNKQATLWLVEKAAEFGLRCLCPVECERSASVADAGRSAGFLAKAERRALAAVKQSGSAWFPEIASPEPLEARVARLSAAGAPSPGPRVVLDPTGPPLRAALGGWGGATPAVVLVGPEGGLTGAELEACGAAGFRLAGLGPTVLRFETAAVAALAIAAQAVAVAATTNEEPNEET